jgi:hypothetical protein
LPKLRRNVGAETTRTGEWDEVEMAAARGVNPGGNGVLNHQPVFILRSVVSVRL